MESVEIRGNKTTSDLMVEAGWYCLYTIAAFLVLVLLVAAFWVTHPNPDASGPKILATILAFVVPMVVGFAVAKFHPDTIAGHVWISGLLFFLVVTVYVLDLPTGNGLCDGCGAVDKLWRTFFSIDRNSGLMGGDGLLIGLWIPLSMIGYAVGAKVGNAIE